MSRINLFPSYGIKLNHFEKFILNCGGREILKNKTTTEVRDEFIIPITLIHENSYCEMVKKLNNINEREDIGEANVFISHAWENKFLDVVDLLLQYFNYNSNINNTNNNKEEEIIIWFDLFSNNQHNIIDLDFNYWSKTFKLAIQKFGRTVMVLSPWNDPVSFKRAWCLWELYCTIITESKFEIAMTNESKQQFIEDVLKDPEEEINKMLGFIDVERSECYLPEDKVRIFHVVKGSIGFSKLNKLIFERLREWVIEVFENKLKLSDYREDVKYLHALAGLYYNQGKYDIAEEIYLECLEKSRNNHPSVIQSINNLGLLYSNQGKYNQSEKLYLDCLEMTRQILGNDHLDTLTLINNLGLLYYNQGKYNESEKLYIECLNKTRQTLGNNHSSTLTSINNLAELYSNQGRYNEAEEFFKECLEKQREILGDNHPDTLTTISNLGLLYFHQSEYDKAEELYLESLEKSRQTLGDDHPDTLISINNVAVLYDKQSKYNESETLYLECIENRTKVLGNNHPDTLLSINNLGVLYYKQGKYDKSEELYVECFEKIRNVLGDNHPSTLISRNNLVVLYKKQCKYEKLDMLYKVYS